MRTILALAAMTLVACGGGADAPEQPDSVGTVPTAAPAPTPPAGTGTRHEVRMVMVGTTYAYEPASLTIKPGDTVVFKGVTGGFHNVQFWPDSVAATAQAALDAVVPNRMGLLGTNLVAEGDSLVFTFAGVPEGRYPYYCLPHQAMGMTGALTIAN
jgi:plastocyanin